MKKPPESPDQKSELSWRLFCCPVKVVPHGIHVFKLTGARKENKDRSSHCRSNCVNVPKLANVC